MIKNSEIDNLMNTISDNNKDLLLKEVPKKDLVKFHRVLHKCLQKLNVIVKGSRALNLFLDDDKKIYTDKELIYIDYDIYSLNYKKDLIYILREFEKQNVKFIKANTIPFKVDIARLFFYFQPIIDLEEIKEIYYKNFNYKIIDGVKYISPEFYKVDAYYILSQPIYITLNKYKKTYKRINLVEEKYKYKTKFKITDEYKENNIINYILDNLTDKTIIVGNYAYNKIIKKNIPVEYLEILTEDIDKYIKLLKTKYKNINKNNKNSKNNSKKRGIYFEKFDKIMYTMPNYVIVYLDGKPILILWQLYNNTSYTVKNKMKICSRYYLRFYYNFLAFYGYISPIFKEKDYYISLLKKIKIKSLPKLKSIGNVNYDSVEQYLKLKNNKSTHPFKYNSYRNKLNK